MGDGDDGLTTEVAYGHLGGVAERPVNLPDGETLGPCDDSAPVGVPPCPTLSVLYHPNLERIGERALLGRLLVGRSHSLARLELDFGPPRETTGRPLADPYMSRTPIEIACGEGGGVVVRPPAKVKLMADGKIVAAPLALTEDEVATGVVLEVGHTVLLLHSICEGSPLPDFDLVGASEAIDEIRRTIVRVADLDVSVLIRGESGVGKERVAKAVHGASPRSDRPFVAINMAAIPYSTAASELFGHTRGAFTGAVQAHDGYFAQADGGTLFLDEIGDTSEGVQSMLLRAIETGEIVPLGGERSRAVDVRILAATDDDLEDATAQGSFSLALFHRLSGYQIIVPPLRDRRDDVARLAMHFAREELARVGSLDSLSAERSEPWLPRDLVKRLVSFPWPGNVRQLRNVMRQLVISSRGEDVARIDGVVEAILASDKGDSGDDERAQAARKPVEVSDDELIEALRASRWALRPAARVLGLPRSTMSDLVARSSKVRRAGDVSAEELSRVHEECKGDLDAMVERLEVSKHGIKLRLKESGIG